MDILVLDDQPERFVGLAHFADAVFVTRNDHAQRMIDRFVAANEMLDELWLDHDLGGKFTTMKTVDYICELAYDGTICAKRVYVHSMNPSAAKSMITSLQRQGFSVARHIPFI